METTAQGTQGAKSTGNGRVKPREHDLDSLAALDVDALGRIYERGTVPTKLDILEGHPRGRMLSVRTLDHGPLSSAIRAFAGSNGFPWGGKSFRGRGETGEGVNRVHLGGRHNLFPFHTRIGPSVLDGKPTVILNYDLPDNPGFIRAIHDEIREVDAGLFLGPAMWKTKNGPVFVLWFALDTRVQSDPIGHP
jgi:hypothetical protein